MSEVSMRVLPEEMRGVAGDVGRLGGEADQVRGQLQGSWNRLDAGWQSYAKGNVEERYREAMGELGRMGAMLEQMGRAVHQTADLIQEADQAAVGFFERKSVPHPGILSRGARGLGGGRGEREPSPPAPDGIPEQVGSYTLGEPTRPDITHDEGFLGQDSPRDPTMEDLKQFAIWSGALAAMQVENSLGGNDLDDGLEAYEHFLHGDGSDLQFSFDEYVREDPSGAQTLDYAVRDAQRAVEEFYAGASDGDISITSEAFYAGSMDPRFPYPQTENWQKAIGAYAFWTSADVHVETLPSGQRQYTMELTIHAEDRYNFNPGAHDIATGTPDAVNGQFELCGLAEQYMHYGEETYTVTWIEGEELDLSGIIPETFPEENPSEFMEWAQDGRDEGR